MKNINENFTSLYKDRLIPAAETYFIAETLHEKRLFLEQLKGNIIINTTFFINELTQGNSKIDSLIQEYEKTYLVNEESKSFSSFRGNLKEYLVSEENIIEDIRNGNRAEVHKHLKNVTFPILAQIRKDLHNLATIQTKVGKELIDNSQSNINSNHILYYLRFILTILVLFFMLVLVRTSPMLTSEETKRNYKMKIVKNDKK